MMSTQLPNHLLWRSVRPDGGPFIIARHFHRPDRQCFPLHDHDFYEVTWTEQGSATQTINGEAVPYQLGDIIFLRPSDRHESVAGPEGITYINIAFPAHLHAALSKRHADWPWHDEKQPLRKKLSARQLERLKEWTVEMGHDDVRPIDLECFLLDVARMTTQPANRDEWFGLPNWLRDALAVFSDPRNLAGGTARLAHLCDRSQEHINRVVRTCQKRTTTDLINDLRLNWAAGELRLSDRSITDIALTCGLEHLGHFYRLFKSRYKSTPRHYRLQARKAASTETG
jgi:AraC family cel operon transcriptional repressor